MYTKSDISRQKQAFWTAFGRYMKPVLSSDGEPVNWINYKTGNKQVQFRMDVDSRRAVIAVELGSLDVFERLGRLRGVFTETLGEDDWTWQTAASDEHGRQFSLVQKQLPGVNIFRNEDWPAIISFLKPRIMALDEFWSMVKYEFSNLAS